jgi:chorismate mutase
MIKAGDRVGIATAITDEKVEKTVLERLRLKAKTYGTDPSIGAESPGKINVDAVVAMYKASFRDFKGMLRCPNSLAI